METLNFGKFKGRKLSDTPSWYQEWLLKQPFFNKKQDQDEMPKIDSSWDGFSRKGQSQEDAVFAWEKRMGEREDCRRGICSCCEGSSYFGI